MAELSESEFVLQKPFKKRYFLWQLIRYCFKKVDLPNLAIWPNWVKYCTDGAWKYFQIERHQRHKKTTATNNEKCRKIRDKKVQKFQNFSLSCLYLSKFVTVVSHCLSSFLLSFIFDCSFFPRHCTILKVPTFFDLSVNFSELYGKTRTIFKSKKGKQKPLK